jgi:hypothetical protein
VKIEMDQVAARAEEDRRRPQKRMGGLRLTRGPVVKLSDLEGFSNKYLDPNEIIAIQSTGGFLQILSPWP